VTLTQKGYVGDYPDPVWFYPDGITDTRLSLVGTW
jgi:hypothetical protein